MAFGQGAQGGLLFLLGTLTRVQGGGRSGSDQSGGSGLERAAAAVSGRLGSGVRPGPGVESGWAGTAGQR